MIVDAARRRLRTAGGLLFDNSHQSFHRETAHCGYPARPAAFSAPPVGQVGPIIPFSLFLNHRLQQKVAFGHLIRYSERKYTSSSASPPASSVSRRFSAQ